MGQSGGCPFSRTFNHVTFIFYKKNIDKKNKIITKIKQAKHIIGSKVNFSTKAK